ncbi:Glyoxalase/Bleomycin resistance protein/Dihydroxybiphenyl dioxygenase [Dactylonectria estremocensis]|uniref:Glyoxalase/Bleomycin resistance protein/Dihydroxybiphenyl dioxygenase n=1 Tax=Dactylonectria estremocensis TaxID=1079267 RepID=A0A9P9EXE0_9HYPO|nr:Glyoxalase/Bleomycin resistance protein/Dihydroxybiphenyl dioxygenase [Dactylonectria estremocensis]
MAGQENLLFNHVGISVPNLDAAIDFYTNVFGFHVLRLVARDRVEHPEAPVFKMYGRQLQKVKVAFLTTGNGIGFEIFEFVDPPYNGQAAGGERFEDGTYTQGGFFHIAITTADIVAVTKRAVEKGGRDISGLVDIYGNNASYISDPWGNVIELMTISYERMNA